MAEDIWTGAAGDGAYDDPKNWSTGSVPGATDDAVIDADGTIFEGYFEANSLSLGSLATFDIVDLSFTLDGLSTSSNPTGTSINDGTILLDGELYLTGTLDNTGTIDLMGIVRAEIVIGDSPAAASATFTGGGTILLGGELGGEIGGFAFASTLDNVDNTIEGAGAIDGLAFRNGGTIEATVSGAVLSIGGGTNAGLLTSTVAGAFLQIEGTTNNAGGTILASPGTVEIDGDIMGGMVLAAGGGTMVSTGGALDGATDGALTFSASLTVADDAVFQLLGTIDNQGTIALDGTTFGAQLVVGNGTAAPATLLGGGTILLSDGALPFGMNYIAGFALDNVDNLIRGAGEIYLIDLANAGTIEATGTASTLLALADTITNTGLLAADGTGSTLTLEQDTIDNAGGTIAAIGGTIVSSILTVVGGELLMEDGGVFLPSVTSLDGQTDGAVTISGAIDIGERQSLAIAGTIDNLGTISIASPGMLSVGVGAIETATLIGDGTILLQGGQLELGSGDNVSNAIIGNGEIIIGANAGTIEATGTTGAAAVATAARLHADASSDATDTTAVLSIYSASLANTGLLSAASSAELDISGTITGSGAIAVADGGRVELEGAVGSPQTVTVAGGGTLALADPTAFEASLADLVAGTTIDLPGVSISGATLDAAALTITGAAFGSLVIPVAGETPGLAVAVQRDGAGGDEVVTMPCYAAGTRIATASGERRVETLRVGDMVRTAAGALRPIVWVGARAVDLSTHPDPMLARPLVIRAGAFGAGRPARDLVVSPDHNIAFEDVLIPAKCLVNGMSVVVDEYARAVTYHHIELETHDLVLAEGLAAETYLDVGNRESLTPDACGTADFSSPIDLNWLRWEALGCRRVILAGPELERARAFLRVRRLVADEA